MRILALALALVLQFDALYVGAQEPEWFTKYKHLIVTPTTMRFPSESYEGQAGRWRTMGRFKKSITDRYLGKEYDPLLMFAEATRLRHNAESAYQSARRVCKMWSEESGSSVPEEYMKIAHAQRAEYLDHIEVLFGTGSAPDRVAWLSLVYVLPIRIEAFRTLDRFVTREYQTWRDQIAYKRKKQE